MIKISRIKIYDLLITLSLQYLQNECKNKSKYSHYFSSISDFAESVGAGYDVWPLS